MDVIPGGSQRPNPEDRNPIKRTGEGANAAGASALADTDLATYTVPAGKKALIESLWVYVENQTTTPLSSGGRSACRIRYTPSGGSEVVPITAALLSGAAGAREHLAMPGGGTLLAGDNIKVSAGVGGANAGANVYLRGGFILMEYDS